MAQSIVCYLKSIMHNHLVIVMALFVVLDTVLGCLRAIMEHKYNSTFGINGAIRKTGMVVSVMVMMLADALIGINATALVSQEIRDAIHLNKVGLGEFFCIMYILYEGASILKNWALLGIPQPKWLKPWLTNTLGEMTDTGEDKQVDK